MGQASVTRVEVRSAFSANLHGGFV